MTFTVPLPPSSLIFGAEPAWLASLRFSTDCWVKCFGVDLEQRREQATTGTSAEILRRMMLQSQVAGCRKTRSHRWNDARFLRWIEYHAEAFDVVYSKLTTGTSVTTARSFVKNFHYVEYLLAKRHRIRMENWSRGHREGMCQLLQNHDRYFSPVMRFHKLHHRERRAFMSELDTEFSAIANLDSA